MTSPPWMDEGACKGFPPEWFFPDYEREERRALNICDQCKVTEPCLEFALTLDAKADIGIWGGTTPRERARMRRRRRATA